MSEATIRAAIKTIVESVDDVGVVLNREPWAATWDVFLDRLKTAIGGSDTIRGFAVSCEQISQDGFITNGVRATANSRHHTFKIRGFAAVDYDNSSETVFLAVVIAVMDALDAGTSSLVAGDVIDAGLSQLDSYAPRVFGGVLCHYAEITQVVQAMTT